MFTEEEINNGHKLFLNDAVFLLGVANLNQLPDKNLPEIAIAGRSNVGKSSILNSVTNRKILARTSNTPGRTRELNFFTIGSKFNFVDLPGYGYARASKEEINKWNALVLKYLKGRANLKRVLILIDSRHGVKKSDQEYMKMLDDSAVPYNIILTKIDKIKNEKLEEIKDKIGFLIKTNAAANPDIIATSSRKKLGIDNLRALISRSLS